MTRTASECTGLNENAYDVPFQYSSQLQSGMYRLEVQLGDIRVGQKVMKQ